MKPVVVILSPSSLGLATRISGLLDGDVHGLGSRVPDAPVTFDDAGVHLTGLFAEGRPIVAIMAAGIVIRLLAPVLQDKIREPAVVAISEDGGSVVPLLGGHHGANGIARMIAAELGGHAAITTAGDVRFSIALDDPPDGYRLVNPEDAKAAMAELLAGASALLEGEAGWLTESDVPFSPTGSVTISVTERAIRPNPLQLHYAPRVLTLGLGCARGCEPQEMIRLAEQALAQGGFSPAALAGVYSVDLKADEAAVHATARHFGVPARFFDADTLEAEAHRLQNPSDVVFAEVGCHGVSEGAALAAAGRDGELAVGKIKSANATAAVARAATVIDGGQQGRSRGRLFVVGIGPGSASWCSPEVSRMVSSATDLVGYSLYLDLLGDLAAGKTRHDYPLGAEERRVEHAMELAGEGRDVALVCSGDAGIYAMATLVFQLLDEGALSPSARRVGIEVSPGISALQAAAARAGAPLGHDFCTISLSDLLTPWEVILQRVRAAAEADFVIAFYNPVSKRRRTQLAAARDILLRHRPADTPVILGNNLGRPAEKVRIVTLDELKVDEVDMLTVVIVGSSESRAVATGDGRNWVYTPRGYAAKPGTTIAGRNNEAAE